jgi:hypothetical protein
MQETKYIINDKPRAWVGCLGCYNNGALNGLWVDGVDAADTDGAGLSEAGKCLKCGADEFNVFDHEGYGELIGGECSPLEAAKVAAAIEQIEDGGHDIERVMTYAANCSLSLEEYDEWRVEYEDAILPYESALEYAEALIEQGALGEIPEHLAAYIDTDKLAHDLQIGGDIWESNGYLFRNL